MKSACILSVLAPKEKTLLSSVNFTIFAHSPNHWLLNDWIFSIYQIFSSCMELGLEALE